MEHRSLVTERVLTCETEFVRVMQCGIQRYSRPLRHRVISHSEHATLFQNIEKVGILILLPNVCFKLRKKEQVSVNKIISHLLIMYGVSIFTGKYSVYLTILQE